MATVDAEKLKSLVPLMKEDVDKYFPEFYELSKRSLYLNAYSFVASREAAEDIMQETYIRFLEGLSGVKEDRSPLGLLYTISRNLSLDYLKKSQREISLEASFPDAENYLPSEEKKNGGDYFRYVRGLVSEKEYRILLLHIVEDLPHREIAEAMKIPIGSVTWSYNNALKKIRKEEEKNEKRKLRKRRE